MVSPTVPPRLTPTPRPLAWMLVVIGLFLLLAAVGLSILLFIVLPPPEGGRQGRVLVLFALIGAIGAVALAGGLGALRHGRMSPVLRTTIAVLGAAFLGACFANMR